MKSWRIFIWKSELWTKSNRKNLFEQTWKAKPIQQILFGIFFDICIFSFWKFFFSLIPSIFYCMVYAQIIKREKKNVNVSYITGCEHTNVLWERPEGRYMFIILSVVFHKHYSSTRQYGWVIFMQISTG